MKVIKLFLVVLFAVALAGNAEAQFFKKLKKAVQRGVEEGVIGTVEEKVHKKSRERTGAAMDTIMGNRNPKQVPQNDPMYGNNPQDAPASQKNGNPTNGSLEEKDPLLEEEHSSSFKRGNIILYEDNFSRDAIGDFPARWNSAQGGELKKLKGYDEKWLRIPVGSVVSLEMTKPLPLNFTLELDMIVPASAKYRMAAFAFGEKPEKIDDGYPSRKSYITMLYSKDNNDFNNEGFRYGINLEKEWGPYKRRNYTVPLNQKIVTFKNHLNKKQLL